MGSTRRGLDVASQNDKYNVVGLPETRRQAPHLRAAYDSEKELFVETYGSMGVGDVGVIFDTHLGMNIDSYESLASRIGRLPLKRCGFRPALTVFIAYAPTSDCDEEVETFYMELGSFIKTNRHSTR